MVFFSRYTLVRTIRLITAQVKILCRRMYFLRYDFVELHLRQAEQIVD